MALGFRQKGPLSGKSESQPLVGILLTPHPSGLDHVDDVASMMKLVSAGLLSTSITGNLRKASSPCIQVHGSDRAELISTGANTMVNLFFFFLMATPSACRSSQAEDPIPQQ